MSKIKYKACIYARLSKDDGDDAKKESNSISNQKALVRDFLSNYPEIEIVAEKVDDGYSGVSFDRPAFNEMMEMIRSRQVNCVVCKDLSRFGRNYIEAGNYIEKVFPFLGVRFIAINDGYDSAEKQNQSSNLVIPFKNLINDAYCKDISVKIRSQLEIKRKKGEFLSAFAVYGYQKDPEDHNKLIPGLYAAGNCLGGRYGFGYSTPFAGNSVGMAITHGWIAGHQVGSDKTFLGTPVEPMEAPAGGFGPGGPGGPG